MKKLKWKWIFLSIAITFAGLVFYYGLSIYNGLDAFNKTKETSLFTHATQASDLEPPAWKGHETVNIVFLGGDSRDLKKNEIPRSDSIIVASIHPVTKKINLFSILRDTYVSIPDHEKGRINEAIVLGGPELTMKTVSDLLGIPVQYYVYTDFQGFIALIDEIGGIEFEVEKDMNYTSKADQHKYDIHLKKGLQHLDGETALQYVRFRHDAMSDFSRSERQRAFLQAIASKMKSSWSLIKLPQILNKMAPFVETNLKVEDMWKLAGVGYSSTFKESNQIPPMKLLAEKEIRRGSQKESVLVVTDEKKLKTYIEKTINETEN